MATVEGNLEALLIAGRELIPRIPAGQDPKLGQDEIGPPFITANYDVGTTLNTNNWAPKICYGLVVNYAPGAVSDGSGDLFWVNFGDVSNSTGSRVLVAPGQPLAFPRGARRVFITGASAGTLGLVASVTWVVDRFASIGTPGPSAFQAIKGLVLTGADVVYNDLLDPSWSVSSLAGAGNAALALQTDVPCGARQDPTQPSPYMFPGNAQSVCIWVRNASSQATTVSLYDATIYGVYGAAEALMHTFNVAAGASAFSFVGPGVGNAVNNNAQLLPRTIRIEKAANGVGVVGQSSVISIYGR